MSFRKKDDETSKRNEDGNGEQKLEEKLPNITMSEDLSALFSPAGNYKMRFTKGSGDLLIRAGAPRKGMDVSSRFVYEIGYLSKKRRNERE